LDAVVVLDMAMLSGSSVHVARISAGTHAVTV
jgi:hypothetical protein